MVRGLPTCYTLPHKLDHLTNGGDEGIVEGVWTEAEASSSEDRQHLKEAFIAV